MAGQGRRDCCRNTVDTVSDFNLYWSFRGKATIAPRFPMGRLDHVHVRVPNRAEAARCYAEHVGFEPVDRFDFWATGFEGGPLQISADGGRTMFALSEATKDHPMIPQRGGTAFSANAEAFIAVGCSLPCGITDASGHSNIREQKTT